MPQLDKESAMVNAVGLPKAPTRIRGLDDILHGGLPEGRVTLIGGGPGTGKTVFGLEFLYRGALCDEPGIFVSFEESADNLRQNALSLGWDLAALEGSGRFLMMEGVLDSQVVVSGEFNLQGFLAIIGGKAGEMGAQRVVIDALDVLMGYFNDPAQEKQQIMALQTWLVKLGLTTVLTTKSVKGTPNTYDFLDYMADCVIHFDQRIENQVNTKRMQIVKYRGSGYGSNEYPYLVTGNGLYFHAISDMGLHFETPAPRVSSGNADLDAILGGGYFRGSCILISGMTGTGKTSTAATFSRAACDEGQKVLYINFEESRNGILAGMHSIGLDLETPLQSGRLWVLAEMPESQGIEEHLYDITAAIERFEPDHLVVDAISACERIAGEKASFDFIMRLVHYCKRRGITILLITQVTDSAEGYEISGIGISSIIDTILTLDYKDRGDETYRRLKAVKSRGTKHSQKYHEFLLTDDGIRFPFRKGNGSGFLQKGAE
jgi:circadian clock protein KaiC